MHEHPILFSGPMVQAIRDGCKTQTRRVVKPQPLDWQIVQDFQDGTFARVGEDFETDPFRCPYGVPGSILVLLGTWATEKRHDKSSPSNLPDKAKIWHVYQGDKPAWCGRTRPGRFVPRRLYRYFPKGEVFGVRVQRVHDISEADALSEGFDVETCARLFERISSRIQWRHARWLEKDGVDLQEEWCTDCVKKAARKHGAEICGYDDDPESDSPRLCADCEVLLHHSLTEYGVDCELMVESENPCPPADWPVTPQTQSAAILANLADGIGDLQKRHHGRLAQIGFATFWNMLNKKRGYGWEKNPWVWVIEFKVVKPCQFAK